MPRILLTGTFNSLNKGDAAMQLSAARAIIDAIEGAQVTISSPFPELDAAFYKEADIVPSSRRRLVLASWRLALAVMWRLTGRRLRFLVGDAESQAFIDTDLVVDLSGDMITEDYGPHLTLSHSLPLLMARALGRPTFVCAQSIGPFKWTRPLARFVLNGVDQITTRDRLTLDYLRETGITRTPIEMTSDLAFLLEPGRETRVDEILSAEGVPDDGKPLLGVSLSRLIESHYGKHNPAAATTEFLDLVLPVARVIADQRGMRLLLMPHVTGPTPAQDDRLVCKRALEHVGGDARMIAGDYGPDELKGVIARCHAFLGARMHANIAALSSAVPVVAIAYSHKTPGIMEMMGQSDLVCPVASVNADGLRERLNRVLDERDAIADELRRRTLDVQRESRKNIAIISERVAREFM